MPNFRVHKLRLKESFDMPSEGIFWIINGDLEFYGQSVTTQGTSFRNIEHIKIWNEIKNKYKVDGRVVDYDYFPRGRVMVNPINNEDGTFSHFDVYIYLDDCINDEENINDIKHFFNLNKPSCKIKYVGSDGGITSNHYTCHNCRK